MSAPGDRSITLTRTVVHDDSTVTHTVTLTSRDGISVLRMQAIDILDELEAKRRPPPELVGRLRKYVRAR